MANDEKIKDFVQNILGCGCPEEVFEHIECQHKITLNKNIVLTEKLKIGKRLLIYTVTVNDVDYIVNNLGTLVFTGRYERDSIDFNRFRLVIVTDRVDEIGPVAEEIFNSLKSADEKVHLHVIEKGKYNQLVEE